MKKIVSLISLLCLTEGSFAVNNIQIVEGTSCPKGAIFKFKKHQFSAHCFNTKGCRVEYANFYDVNDADDVTSPPPPEDMLSLVDGFRLGIRNFPEPAKVAWRSLDGVRHEATIDMGKIFEKQCVIHDVPSEKIAEGVEPVSPSIILVVNDKELSVYMKSMIFLRDPVRPENPHSDFVIATALAYRKTF